MSDFEDHFSGGAVQAGDYVSTDRTNQLVPADGRDVYNYGYAALEKAVPVQDRVEKFDFIDEDNSRAMAVQARGQKGWSMDVDNPIINTYNFLTGVKTTFNFGGVANGGYDVCCSDSGDKVFILAPDISAGDLFCIASVDNGVSWTQYTVFNSGFGVLTDPEANQVFQLGQIQCDITGDNLRVTVLCSNSIAQTAVYESTDSGQTWAEVLTPRQTLTNPDSTGNSAISRDLTTVAISSDTELYIADQGAALVDVATNYPGDLSADTKLSVSDDGDKVIGFEAISGSYSDRVIFHLTEDGGTSWRTYNLPLGLTDTIRVGLSSVYFDPNDPSIIFFLVSVNVGANNPGELGSIYRLDTASGDLVNIGSLDRAATTIAAEYAHIGSDFKANGAGLVFSTVEGTAIDRAYLVDITTGIVTRHADPDERIKMFVGRQLVADGTLGFLWTQALSPSAKDNICAYISSAKDVIVIGGGDGNVINSVDSGATFNLQTSGFSANFVKEIDGSDDSSIIVAAAVGEVRRSTNDGVTWNTATGLTNTGSSTDDEYYLCSCTADGVTFVVGAREGTIDISTDSGATFTALNAPFSGETNTKLRSGCIARDNDQIIFVGSEGGLIKRTINQGTAWLDPTTPPIPSPDETRTFAIACSDDGSVVAAAISDKLFLSTDTGDTWAEVAVGFTKVSFRRISMSEDGQIIFVGDNNSVVIRSLDGGQTWYKTRTPWEQTGRKCDPQLARDGTLAYAVSDDGFIYKAI